METEIKINEYFSPTYEIIKRLRTPEKLYISSRSPALDDMMDRIIRDINSGKMFGMPVIGCDYSPGFGTFPNITYEPFKFCKINETEKETKKMEAKKCDRCGKLYEMPGARESGSGAKVRFKFEQVARAEEKSGTKIAEEQMKDIYIKYGFVGDTFVDFCPDCRASLKKWFENPEKEGK